MVGAMMLFESVPNFSAGRDSEVVDRIVAAARGVAGVTVLDVEANADHNRCVVSLVGAGDPLLDALLAMMRTATELILLTTHRGEHPRMGATDVVPFVPLGEATTADAVALAERLAQRVWGELGVPVYLYADAARVPERRDLAAVRAGQFEGIRDSIATDPSRAPDVGEPRVHPTAGIVAIGARPVLIAYNAYLTTPDVEVARRVAHAVRARDGGLAAVKALGLDIKERGRAQVSMNLVDYRATPIHRALEAVRREAARYGAGIEESEIVGLVPQDALLDAAEHYLQLNAFDRSAILERRLRAAEPPAESLDAFCARLAARTPTPGGGSAAAASGALGAALGEMVLAYSKLDPADLPAARARFLALVTEDAAAYDGVRAARRAATEHPADPEAQAAWTAAVRHAAEVPLETARLARSCLDLLQAVRTDVRSTVTSDLTTALALLAAAREGALANVEINLDDLHGRGVAAADLAAEVATL
jgi:glutamate formiminotransferase/formiminotetrahydrofolate cyclodeaminase